MSVATGPLPATAALPGASLPAERALLEVRGLSKRFGGLIAVSDLDFDVLRGEILGLIGPNGAGKTTTFSMIAGSLEASDGAIHLAGESILGLPPHDIAARGIMRTFQHNMPFPSMTVAENVLVGMHCGFEGGLWRVMLRRRAAQAAEAAARARADELVDFVGLQEFRHADVAALSFGQGRLLETARALAGNPRLMLFDEPAAGLTLAECARLAEIIRGIAARGISVLLIEHDMHFLLRLAQRVVVLNFGCKIADGSPREIQDNATVREAYLGTAAAAAGGASY